MPNIKKKWLVGESTSIRLTDVISPNTFSVLNNEEVSNRNKFIVKGMNSQAIIEYGSLEEKLQLIGISNISELLNIPADKNDRETDQECSNIKKIESIVIEKEKPVPIDEDDGIPSIGS